MTQMPPAAAVLVIPIEQAGAFEIERYDDESAARQAIEDREVYAVWALAGLAALAWPMRRTLRARWTRSMPQVTGSPTT